MGRTWVVGAVVAALVVPAAPVSGTACGRAAAVRAGRWFVASPPRPERSVAHQALNGSAQRVSSAAVDPADPRVVLMSDGARVQRSDDGGCTWREVWALGADEPVSDITSLDVARVAGRSRVLLTVVTRPPFSEAWASPVRVQVVRSDDGRGGWATVYETFGTLTLLHPRGAVQVRSGAGGAAYVAVPTAAGTVGWAATADGRTWQARSTGDTLAWLHGFAVSPWDPDEVYVWGSRAETGTPELRLSADGARTWRVLDPWPAADPDPTWTAADVAWPRRGAPARVVVPGGAAGFEHGSSPTLAWSGDGGATFGVALPPRGAGIVLAKAQVTHTPRGDAIVVAEGGEVYRVPNGPRVPRREDWRALARYPADLKSHALQFGHDAARASATAPCVVLLPEWTSLPLLTVPP